MGILRTYFDLDPHGWNMFVISEIIFDARIDLYVEYTVK
jgi:hypothetical protein